MITYLILFFAKVLDNALGTSKTILIQRNKWFLSGITVLISDFLYFWVISKVVSANNNTAIFVVAIAGGFGCSIACLINDRFSKDRTYVNVIMSDNLDEMKSLRDFLAEKHITNVATDSYTLDWNTKTISVTAYADTKAQHKLIQKYLDSRKQKFKRVVNVV